MCREIDFTLRVDFGPGCVLVGWGEEAPWDSGGLAKPGHGGVGAVGVPVSGHVALPADVAGGRRLVVADVASRAAAPGPVVVVGAATPPVVHPVPLVVVVASRVALDRLCGQNSKQTYDKGFGQSIYFHPTPQLNLFVINKILK